MSNKLIKEDQETKDMKQFLTNLRNYQKEKGVTPQLVMWYYSEDGQKANEIFTSRLKSLLVTTVLAEDVETEPSIQGLIGADFIRFNIGNSGYEYKIDWTEEQNKIFFHGPKAAAKYYTDLIRQEVIEAAKNS